MTATPPRIAVIGAGLIGRRHIACVADEPGAALAGVVEPDAAAGAEAASLAAGAGIYPSVEALAAAEPVDAAIVATPTPAHREAAIDCLRRGWAILVEKPIADSADAARAMIETAEESGVPLLVGHHRRHHHCIAVARRLIAEGAIGRLAAVSVQWATRKPEGYFAPDWRRAPGGGPVMINLIHDIDLLRHLCGEIVEVTAATGSAMRGHANEDSAAVLLRFSNGALGTIVLTDAAISPWTWEGGSGENPGIAETGQSAYRLMGTAGSLELPSLTLWQAGQEPADWSTALNGQRVAYRPTEPLPAQLRHFLAVLRGEAEPLVSGADGLATLQATEAVLNSATTHQPVRLTGGPEQDSIGKATS